MRKLLLATACSLLFVGACSSGGSSTPDQSPAERLSAAKASFDDAEFIGFTLATDSLPDGVDGLIKATGTGTHAPAFIGEVDVKTALDISAPLVAVDDVVYAQLPLVGWTEISPSDYGAPDPANLMDTDSGISSLFLATRDVTEGDSERDGEAVLTSIDGTIPGDAVKGVFPSAGTDPFDVSYVLTAEDDIDSITVTGPFYAGSDDVTYTLDFDLAADKVDIEAPI